MKSNVLLTLCLVVYASAAFSVDERAPRELIMGYNASAKDPLIAAAPDNSGAYIDLYTRVAEKIGYELKIVRYPKKRVYLLMQEGKIDFYPGMKFKPDRADFAYFIANGLPTGRTGISRRDLPEVTSLSQLRDRRVVLPIDGIDYTDGTEGISIDRVRQLDIQKAYQLLANNRADFYATDDIVVVDFLKQNRVDDIRIHPNFLPTQPMTLGFSRFSPYFSAEKNPDYDPAKGASFDNDPWMPKPGSVPQQMQQALEEMIRDGEIDKIYQTYYTIE